MKTTGEAFPPLSLLGNFLGDDVSAMQAGYHLYAYIAYPHDEAKRMECVRLRNIEVIHQFKSVTIEKLLNSNEVGDSSAKHVNLLRDRALDMLLPRIDYPKDPVGYLVESSEKTDHLMKHLNSLIEEHQTIYYLSTALMRMRRFMPDAAGGDSLNKAIFLTNKMKIKGMLHNEKYIKNAWTKYRCVAHLIVPYVTVRLKPHEYYQLLPTTVKGIGQFLGFARNIQKFLLEREVTNNKKKYMMEVSDLWSVPAEWEIPEIPPLELHDFSSQERVILQNYKAKKSESNDHSGKQDTVA